MTFTQKVTNLTLKVKAGATTISKGIILITLFTTFPIVVMLGAITYIMGIVVSGSIIFGEVPTMEIWEKIGIILGVIGTTVALCAYAGSSAYD